MTITLLNASRVTELLPMPQAIQAMAQAMAALSEGKGTVPPRMGCALPGGKGSMGLMPGAVVVPATAGAKLATLMPHNPAAGRPAIQAVVCLFDPDTGALSAILEGASLTRLRTAAVSGLATRLLAREDAATHGVFGCGALLPWHIDAICAARPSVSRTLIWGRDLARTQAAARREAQRTGREILAVEDASQAASCDVVSTITSAKTPVLLGKWLRPGTHVNLVGAHRSTDRETDTEAITRSRVFVDQRDGALREAGELLIPIAEGAYAADRIAGELGEVELRRVRGRQQHEDITLFKSLGVIVQDLIAARTIVERAAGRAATQVEW